MRTRGSHRPSLRTLAKQTLRRVLGEERSILVATSGGPDSQVLLHVLAGLREELALDLRAHGVDHGLRAEAARELDLAEALATREGVPFSRSRVQVTRGGNLQARARAARYEALRAAAAAQQGRTRALVATGHHADDRAETVLQRLLRATAVESLGVLPARADDRVRPLVEARRDELQLYLARHQIPFATDPSNEDPRFLRTRVRREVLPLLAALNPRIVEHLCALADDALALDRPALGLPKGSRETLTNLLRNARTSPEKARAAQILLPGGLVLRVATPHGKKEHPRDTGRSRRRGRGVDEP